MTGEPEHGWSAEVEAQLLMSEGIDPAWPGFDEGGNEMKEPTTFDWCVFCDYEGPKDVLLTQGEGADEVFVIAPLNPVCDGHLLVIPRTHVSDFTESGAVTARVMAVAASLASGWPHANLITSKGEAATQSVGHLHVHLLPRKHDDGLPLPWDLGGLGDALLKLRDGLTGALDLYGVKRLRK